MTVFYGYTEVNRLWGAYTTKVNPSDYETAQTDVVITHVNLLSEDATNMIPNQSVVIHQGSITAVGSDISIPTGYQVIDGTGQYLIPGLIDSHVHLWQSPNDLLLYLANGITHIKEMNGSEEHLQWKQEIEQGRPGPDMFVASRRHNSNDFIKGWFDRLTAKINPVNDMADIEDDLLALKAQGFDAIKVYTFLKKKHFMAFNETAKKHDIKLLGHTPISMTLDEVWGTELRELGHVEEIVKALIREFAGYDYSNANEFLAHVASRKKDIISNLLKHDITVQTTLTIMEGLAPIRADVDQVLQQVELEYVNPGITESTHPSIPVLGWLPKVNIYRLPDDIVDDMSEEQKADDQIYWKTYAEANRMLIRAFAQNNVKLLAATDANVPARVPGFSLHEELVALNKAGLSNAAVLKTATTNPAQAMGIKTGKIKAGYQADMLLLNDNPLQDIKHTQNIKTVINNGRIYDRDTLNRILTAVKAANDESRTEDISHYH
ncbi:amidohydrolase family protein [Marinicella rhabdoformis]|uniref:amidohydrolase family protein n=1 Tax=Marinicella rhabdoformis TaxID=2580566 RepID=UPI001C556677|nr:amidohydrolase family protein [Marinicella rhabdoformis]